MRRLNILPKLVLLVNGRFAIPTQGSQAKAFHTFPCHLCPVWSWNMVTAGSMQPPPGGYSLNEFRRLKLPNSWDSWVFGSLKRWIRRIKGFLRSKKRMKKIKIFWSVLYFRSYWSMENYIFFFQCFSVLLHLVFKILSSTYSTVHAHKHQL